MDLIGMMQETLLQLIRRNVPVQVVYATCQSVEEDSMTAVREEIEYHDVLLGLGKHTIRPVVGSLVMLGVVENQPAATVLLYAEEVEKQAINGDTYGGLVKADALTARLNALENDINEMKSLMASWVPVPNDGGASMKTTMVNWYSDHLTPTDSASLQNEIVTHG